MKKNVLTDTVRELSEQAAGTVPHDATPPSREFFLKNIKGRYQALINKTEKKIKDSPNDDKSEMLQEKLERYRKQIKRFEETMKKVPDQFSISELMYTRITSDQNKIVMNEFSDYVRPRFLMFLAERFPDDLKQLGICEHGIERMRNGLDPEDEDRNAYNMTIDHIIERSGSGTWGYDQELDEGIHNGHRETFIVNHFANLTMLPSTIHSDIKNVINEVQDLPSLHAGEAKWFMSVIPRGNTEAESYMYVPENDEERKKYIRKAKRRLSNEISHLYQFTRSLNAECDVLQEYADMAEQTSSKKKGTRAKKVSHAFNKQHDLGRVYYRRVKPLLTEIDEVLTDIEARIDDVRKNDKAKAKEYDQMLAKALRGRGFSILNKKIRDVEELSQKPDGRVLFSHRRKILDRLTGGCHRDPKGKPNHRRSGRR